MQSVLRYITNRAPWSLILLAGLVFQMAACPCGCIEHNGWVLLAGHWLHPHDESHDCDHQVPELPGLNTAHDHDCDGRPRDVYVKETSRSYALSATSAPLALGDIAALEPAGMPREAVAALSIFPGRPSAAALRAQLQVYRL